MESAIGRESVVAIVRRFGYSQHVSAADRKCRSKDSVVGDRMWEARRRRGLGVTEKQSPPSKTVGRFS